MKETIQDVLQLILQADDIKYVKNSGILNYGLDLKQVVEREIELSVCKGDKEILLAMNYDSLSLIHIFKQIMLALLCV